MEILTGPYHFGLMSMLTLVPHISRGKAQSRYPEDALYFETDLCINSFHPVSANPNERGQIHLSSKL